MPTIDTCGHESRREEFSYRGTVEDGVVLLFDSGEFTIDADIINATKEHFRGRRVRGGFNMTDSPSGSVGSFLAQQGRALTPRHASFLCPILQHEGHVQCELEGNTVWVTFPA